MKTIQLSAYYRLFEAQTGVHNPFDLLDDSAQLTGMFASFEAQTGVYNFFDLGFS